MKLFRFLPALLMALVATACVNDDTIDGEVIPVLTDMVTFDGNVDGRARFSFNMVDDSPMINLTGNRPLEIENLNDGDRIVLSYQPLDGQRAYASGNVEIKRVLLINNDVVKVVPKDDIEGWNDDPVYLYSVWRSGNYVNIYCRLPYSADPRRFGLVATESSISNGVVNLYLMHDLPEPVNSHDRAYYASFDISPVWSLPGVTGVRVHLANSNLNKNEFLFLKQ